MEKITLVYGIEKCAIAKLKNDKTHEYDKIVDWPSAIQLSESTKESAETFYADNGVWAVINGQSVIEGKLDCYVVSQEIRELLGWETTDKNNLSIEVATPEPVRCALLYTYRTNKGLKRACLYDVTFTKPNQNLTTIKEKVDPSTVSINFKAVPVAFDGFDATVTKIKTNEQTNKETIDNWYQKVILPTAKDKEL